MANRDYTPHQQKIIKRYYDNREQIDEQRLAELVTNLYLASDKKKKEAVGASRGNHEAAEGA